MKLALFFIFMSLFLNACNAKEPVAKNNLEMALLNLVNESPMLAVVKHQRVTIEKVDDNTDKHTYIAQVLHSYRGQKLKTIEYDIYVESGEESTISKAPVLIALCGDQKSRFYWPGTGSQITLDDTVNQWLQQHKSLISENHSNSVCE